MTNSTVKKHAWGRVDLPRAAVIAAVSAALLACALFLFPSDLLSANGVSGGGGSVVLKNPLGTTDVYCFVKSIMDVVTKIGFVVVVLAIIYSGFLFVTAQGSDEKLKTAKTAITWTLIGAAVLLGAWVFAEAIAGTVGQIVGENILTRRDCP